MATRTSTHGVHAHGCSRCHRRFEDACNEPNTDKICRRCEGHGTGWALLEANRAPKDCCRLHSRLARKDELKTYRLSTACPWFRCSICARTFPYVNPTRESA